jgi:hypothetical protein
MFRKRLVLGVVSILGLVVLAATSRSEPVKAPPPDQATQKKETEARKQAHARLHQLILAHRLIALGRDNEETTEHRAAALLLAAELLARARPIHAEFKSDKGETLTATVVTPEALVEEARKLGKDAPAVQALAEATAKVIKEEGRDPSPRPSSFSGDLKGQGIYERSFVQGRPAAVFAFCPGGQVVTVRVMNTDTVPPTVVGEQTGSSIRIEWLPMGQNREVPHKIFITPQSPVPFFITWATN